MTAVIFTLRASCSNFPIASVVLERVKLVTAEATGRNLCAKRMAISEKAKKPTMENWVNGVSVSTETKNILVVGGTTQKVVPIPATSPLILADSRQPTESSFGKRFGITLRRASISQSDQPKI